MIIYNCFRSTSVRSFGGFLGYFSFTKQNFVGIDSVFKSIRVDPDTLLKHSASK